MKELYLAFSDPRVNTVRVIQCLFNDTNGLSLDKYDRITLKAIEKSPQSNKYYNQYYYIPQEALAGIATLSIVSLLEEDVYNEPFLIHTQVQVTTITGETANSVLTERVTQMTSALLKLNNITPTVVYEMIPEEHLPAELKDI